MGRFAYIMGIVCLLYAPSVVCQTERLEESALDSIKTGKIIHYHEDAYVHHTRQELFLRNFANVIGLPPIFNGVKGVYIRIWLWNGNGSYVINIRSDSSHNKCSIVELGVYNKDSSHCCVILNVWKDINPQSGWPNFMDSLNKYQIFTLKSGKTYEEHKDNVLTTMSYVQFEIAEPHSYRFYEYLEPSFYRFVEAGSQDVYEFLEFFNKEMNVQVYNPAKKLFEEP
jgi:hypothetical protein